MFNLCGGRRFRPRKHGSPHQRGSPAHDVRLCAAKHHLLKPDCLRGKSLICLSSPVCKNIFISFRPKSPAYFDRLIPHEGTLAIVTNVGMGWDAVDAKALLTNSADADGEVVWS
jgi:hypothetical protein